MKTVQDLFKLEKQAWLEDARSAARTLLKNRPYITIEDVLEITPRPQYVHPNTTGQVFLDNDFVAVGWMPSKLRSMNGRQVRRWVLRVR